jgi:hypothetical protein
MKDGTISSEKQKRMYQLYGPGVIDEVNLSMYVFPISQNYVMISYTAIPKIQV